MSRLRLETEVQEVQFDSVWSQVIIMMQERPGVPFKSYCVAETRLEMQWSNLMMLLV